MLLAYQWPDHLLLVTFFHGSSRYTMLLSHATQAQFFEKVTTDITKAPHSVSVVDLSDESFDLLVDTHQSNGLYIEG